MPRPTAGVQSVIKAVDILEALAAARSEVALSDLAAEVALPLPTIHRLVRTLVSRGLVHQLPNRRYALGAALIPLGDAARSMLSDWAEPVLTRLVERLGETANLAILDGDQATYVSQVPSRHSMRMFTEVGRKVDTHCTGVGKALLAQLDDDAVRKILARTGMPPMTSHTITDPDALVAELDLIRRQGYALDRGEQEVGVFCVAVCLRRTGMAVSVSGPETRMTPELVARAVPELTAAAEDLSAAAPDLLAV
jgi:IclR family acetate operon transcriptional repressor